MLQYLGIKDYRCSSFVKETRNTLAQNYKNALQDIYNKYNEMIAFNIMNDASQLYGKLSSIANKQEFQDDLFLRSLKLVYTPEAWEEGGYQVGSKLPLVGGAIEWLMGKSISGGAGDINYSLYGLWNLLWKIRGLVNLVNRYLPDFIGSVKVFLIVAFFISFTFVLLFGNPKWVVYNLGIWMFLDSIYIANAVAARVRYEYLIGGTSGMPTLETVSSLLGIDSALMRGDIAYFTVMLIALIADAIITWKGIALAGAFASQFATSTPVLNRGVLKDLDPLFRRKRPTT